MAKAPRLYARLTRPTTSVGSYKSLWLAADHLLVVNSTGYAEEYVRIQFENIRGFFTIASNRRSSWFLFWAPLGLFAGIIATIGYVSDRMPTVSLVVCGIAAAGTVWNHLLGPSCKVFVVTGVQTMQLPSLVRQRKARKVLGRIEPLIVAAQRDLRTDASVAAPAVGSQPPALL